MKRTTVFVSALSIIALAMMLIGWTMKAFENRRVKQSPTAAAAQRPPEYVVYNMLFHQVKWLNETAAKFESEGKNGAVFRNRFQTLAKLTNEQAAILNQVAQETNAQVSEIEARASVAIDKERARRKAERVTTPPVLTPELKALEQERKDAILSGVAALKARMGEERFAQFAVVVQDEIANKVTMQGLNTSDAHFPWMEEKSPRSFNEAKKGGLK
jgi:hypothetical protein